MDPQIVLGYLQQQIAKKLIHVTMEDTSTGVTVGLAIGPPRMGASQVLMNVPKSPALYHPGTWDEIAENLSNRMIESIEAEELKK